MAKRSMLRKRPPGVEQASFMFEAVFAATIALTVTSGLALMFEKQIDLAKRARDTDLLEAAVNKDVNSLRQAARYWRMSYGPYSQDFLDASVTGIAPYTQRPSGSLAYRPAVRSECLSKDLYLLNFIADLKVIVLNGNIPIINSPRAFNVQDNITPTALASRYLLTRTMQRFSADSSVPTARLTYQLKPLNNSPPLALERTAELQIEMQTGC
ncbi:MAG: hypothetical protein ACK59G_08740 [Cyanobacteriota bacterium]|jgi:hypothetical protein